MTRTNASRRDPVDPMDFYPPEPETHLRDYWYVILKRRWLLAAVSVTATALFALSTLLQTPVFTATAVLQIDLGKINLVQDVMVKDSWVGYAEFYPTQQRVIRSRTLARRVVDALELWQHPLFRSGTSGGEPTPERREGLAGAVQSMLDVRQIRSTQLLEVSFTTPDPELSARLANTLVRQYIHFSSETQSDLARDTGSFIKEQIEKLQVEIQAKENLLQDYSRREDIILVGRKENIVTQQLEDLNRQLSEAKASRAAAEARYQSLRQADPRSLPEAQNAPGIQSLKSQRAALQKQYAELASRFKPGWPEMERTEQGLEEIERALERETKEVAEKLVAAARVDYQAALRREALLQQALDGQKKEAQEMNRATVDYDRIQVELDSQRAMLQQLLRRHSETGLSADLGERQPVNVRVVEEALVPGGPSSPRLRRNLVTGALLGLALAVGLAFFLDYWDTTIHNIEDLTRQVSLPYLGMVPRFPSVAFSLLPAGSGRALLAARSAGLRRGAAGKDLAVTRSALALRDPGGRRPDSEEESIIAERFKFIRGSLLLSSPGRAPRTLLVTGPDKNAGKTFVACHLAVSLAELDKSVLLIDADLRNPQVHKVFRFRNRVGLSNLLTSETSIENGGIYSTPLPRVFVMLSGPPSPSPAELLGSAQMEQILERCTSHFDYVLLDSAPLLPVFDSHLLTAKCDACLLVVRSGHTSRQAVKTSLDLIDRVGGKVTGVILNDVNLEDYAQSYYHSYYSYEYATYPRE